MSQSTKRRTNLKTESSRVQQHILVAKDTISRLRSATVSTLLIGLAIGFALFLPLLLLSIAMNAAKLASGLDESASFSVYLLPDVDEAQGLIVSDNLLSMDQIEASRFVSSNEALIEFKTKSGLAELLDGLGQNPLPASIELSLTTEFAQLGPENSQVQQLLTSLEQIPEVESVQMDSAWLQRLSAISNLISRVVMLVAVFAGLAVIFIIGNTIRMTIAQRQDEIRITRLVGGSESYIARPFLYTGACYGFLGGTIAVVFHGVALLLISPLILTLNGFYGDGFVFDFYAPIWFFSTILGACFLGWSGALVATIVQLRQSY